MHCLLASLTAYMMSDNACQTRQAQQMFRRSHKNRFSRSSTSKPDSVVRRDSPLNRPHPSPHLAEMGVRSAHARARQNTRAPHEHAQCVVCGSMYVLAAPRVARGPAGRGQD